MIKNEKKWEILNKFEIKSEKLKVEDIVDILLKNRGIKTKKQKEEFFNPTPPEKITIKNFGLDTKEIAKAITRIEKARKKKEKVIIYGDYDADGICGTAVVWETLHGLGIDALPYIPERFSEGYGMNVESIQKLKTQYPKLKLIVSVDNGIVASDAIEKANSLGIDVVVTDHHQKGRKKLKAHSVIHTTEIGGAGVAWVFARELIKKIQKSKNPNGNWKSKIQQFLELVAIGTIADQIPLLGANRSIVKYGLEELNKTKRVGLIELFREAGLNKGPGLEPRVGTYEVGYLIAPRINATGRIEHAIDSLRLLCTKDKNRAKELALYLGKINRKRQKIVEEVLVHTKQLASKREWKGVIIVADKSYHEGVIGLAASKLVKEFYRPAIVISQGNKVSKGSARSVSGFNIFETINKLDSLIIGGGGHPMAAGFSIATENVEQFSLKLEKISSPLLTDEVLSKKLKVDIELNFSNLSWSLQKAIEDFEPTGLGNPTPTFMTRELNVLNVRAVGFEKKHLKLKLEQDGSVFDAIAFGMGDLLVKLTSAGPVDAVYVLEENIWNGDRTLQLKVKDIKIINKEINNRGNEEIKKGRN